MQRYRTLLEAIYRLYEHSGFAMAGAPAIVRFVGGTVTDAHRTTQEMYEITLAENPAMAIPIIEPEAVHQIGLVVPPREPMTPLVSALVAEATHLATKMG